MSYFSAELVFASGKNKKGVIQIVGNVIKFTKIVNNIKTNDKVAISEIKAIEFYEWKGEKKWKGNYVFYPYLMKIYLKNREVIEVNSNISELNEIKLVDNNKKQSFYTYFYDFRKNNKWVNSGIYDLGYPEKNPHFRTVTKIKFMESNTGLDINNLIKKILE